MREIPAVLIASGLLKDLPTPPAVAMEILRLADDPESGLDDLATVVERDPALSARLVAMSNSAAYARASEVTSVKDAANVLGARTMSLIALSFSLASGLQTTGTVAGLDLDQFWKRSLTVAAVARHLARAKNRALADEAFLAGLLAYLGRLVMAQNSTPPYKDLLRTSAGWPAITAEAELLGFSSSDVSAAAAAEWGLPGRIGEAIAHAFQDTDAEPAGQVPSLGELLGLAVVTDASINDPENNTNHEQLERRFRAHFGGDEKIFEGVVDQINEVSDTLNVSSTPELDSDDLLTRARVKMFEATLALADVTRIQAEQVDSLSRERDDLAEAASRDPLTGLANRRALSEAIRSEIGRRIRDNVYFPLGAVMIDIDHFRSFNETYGHAFGDEVLTATATSLAAVVRRNEMLYRYGGEEFILLIPTVEIEALAPIGERLRKTVESQTFQHEGKDVHVTVSVGVAASSRISDEDSINEVIGRADELLYAAKHAGRNCVMVDTI